MIAETILSMLLSLPTYAEDRTPDRAEAKQAQLEAIAGSVARAVDAERPRWPGSSRELAAVLVTIAHSESTLSLRVHAGQCHRWECDRGRARGLFQIQRQRWMAERDWGLLHGTATENTDYQARAAARIVVRMRGMCRSLERDRDWVEMVLVAYGRGRGCIGTTRTLPERVAKFRRLMGVRSAS